MLPYMSSLCLLVMVGLACSASKKFPKNWKTCKKSSPDLNDCLKIAIEEAILDLKNGSRALGVPPLEPLHFKELNIEQPGGGPVALNLSFYEIDISGVRSLKVDSVKADWESHKLEINGHFEEPCVLTGNYSVGGSVLILPIVGKGDVNMTFVDFKFKLNLGGKIVKKNNQDFFEVTKAEFLLDTSRLHTYLGNLFNGDKALGDNMNRFLNDNWEEILQELKGSVSKAFGEGFKGISNLVFRKIPLSSYAS